MIEKIVQKMLTKRYMLDMGAGNLARRFKCSREDIYKAKEIIRGSKVEKQLPKILILDIETAPLLAYIYSTQVWKAVVRDEAIVSQWFILTWAAKWLGGEMMSAKCTPEEVMEENDNRIIRELWKVLDEADIVIAHNGDRFDIPNINTRFLINGLGPTSHYRQIDTLQVARKQFGFTHNTLDSLAKQFGIDGKIHTGFELWKQCLRGNVEALADMEVYNCHDVEILEEVYLKLRPWIKNHPNLALYNDNMELQCPNCGSTNVEPNGHFFYTHTGKYPTHRCKDCGHVPRERKSVAIKGRKLLVSIPGR
jgi:DNA polymerase III epsilon subunit-like protein